jgi:hypothetical protein
LDYIRIRTKKSIIAALIGITVLFLARDEIAKKHGIDCQSEHLLLKQKIGNKEREQIAREEWSGFGRHA